jgi:large subunit ribosomal protein L10e
MLRRETIMKARNYRDVKGPAYTRKKYIRGTPQSKITKFTMGDPSAKYEYKAVLVAKEEVQIRHNALEAVRISVNRVLAEKLGTNYYLRVVPYPHTVLRENRMIFGAHADRLQQGMRKSFGKPIGTAARVKPNQSLIEVDVNTNGIETVKIALKRGQAKLPTTTRIIIEKTSD